MPYDATKPEDTGFLSEAPKELRTNFEGLKKDQIVDAALLKGLAPGNASGNIPVANGAECENLNAAKINGKTASDFAPKAHIHDLVTISSDGFMSAADKVKLNSIAANAEVNQNAFGNVLIKDTTIQADSKTDTLEIIEGANISIIPDATNDRVTIAVTGKVPSAENADFASSAGNSETVGGKHTSDFVSANQIGTIGGDKDNNPRLRLQMPNANGTDIRLASDGTVHFTQYDNEKIYRDISVANIFSNGKQTVTIDQIPKTLPANGGNADTVGGKYPADFLLNSSSVMIDRGNVPTDWNNAISMGVYKVFPEAGQVNSAVTALGLYAYGQLHMHYTSGVYHQTYYSHTGQIALRQSWEGKDKYQSWKQVSTADMVPKIGIKSGVILHGQQIPLPDGFEQLQCQWMVSPNQIWNDDHDNLHGYHIYCWADANRWVTCYQHDYGKNGSGDRPGSANFMIVGVKY